MAKSGPKEAYRYLEGQNGSQRWVSLTWDRPRTKVFALAAGLLSVGVQAEDRVAIASGTRMEWILADLAIMCAGACDHDGLPEHPGPRRGLHPGQLRFAR